jgi:hypothetical protein
MIGHLAARARDHRALGVPSTSIVTFWIVPVWARGALSPTTLVAAPIEPFARCSLFYRHEHPDVPCHSRVDHPRTPRLAACSEIRGLRGAGRQSMPPESIWRANGPQSANENATFGAAAQQPLMERGLRREAERPRRRRGGTSVYSAATTRFPFAARRASTGARNAPV